MKSKTTTLFFLLFNLFTITSFGQIGDYFAASDTFCVQLDEIFEHSVLENDFLPQGDIIVELNGNSPCFLLNPENGILQFRDTDIPCCGEHILKYNVYFQGQVIATANIQITVKCPKPPCFLVDLEDFTSIEDPSGGEPQIACVYACENSEATYFVSYNPTNTYTWAAIGGTISSGANAAEINVVWGNMGTGTISLAIIDSNNQTRLIEVCVEILEGPTADFTVTATTCLNATVYFTNNSIGGDDFFWDFGDGNTSTLFEPTHQYATAGTYTATLYVTKNNFDAEGNPLCCCTDSISMEVTVDPLEGPEIYCISTLCANDDSKYWTNATNCGTYNWTVLDANNVPIAFDGQGTDSICVQWGGGPFGIVMLEVSGCDDNYCPNPTVVKVPIIPQTVAINGLTEVCSYETATYTVPKWISVYYNWQVTGGTIVSGQGTNTVVIHWGTAPGPGIITLNYSSDFLSGLPGHETPDCTGFANLTVAIKPEFIISVPIPNPVCVNSSSTIYASSFPFPDYTWTINPPASFTGQNTSNITVNWDNGPGTYEVTAVPNDSSIYCNDTVSILVQVVELPTPTGIHGEVEICPEETYTYFGQSSESGLGFQWNVTGGSPSTFTGNPLVVTWNNSGPYSIDLQQFQLNSPFCTSDPISLNISPKIIIEPLTISGTSACINEISIYNGGPVQDPDATYNWSISPASLGSIINGQGTPNIQIQWNNDPGTANLVFTVDLCNNSVSESLSIALTAPIAPVITQIGDLCPGVSATLDAGAGYGSYQWSTFATSQSISISSGGTYVVTVTDANGCEAIASYQAIALPGPTAHISTPDFTSLCIIPPNSNTVNIIAQTNPSYTYEWHCNGTLQVLPAGQSTFVHTNTNVIATFNYWVVVTDANGCTSTSNIIPVIQTDNCGGPPCPVPPGFYTLTYTATNPAPDCNVVEFNVSSTNVVLNNWIFGDPDNNINTGTLSNAEHTYNQAGYYMTTVYGTVTTPLGTCAVSESQSVCIPIAADFIYNENCQTIDFTDLSSYLPGHDINTWAWDFGDGNFSSSQHPTHFYASAGSYTVSLTVSNANGCAVTISQTVIVIGLPNPAITANPNPVCVGDPVSFTGSGTGIISWFWDFDDGATNGSQNPFHSYDNTGTYDVTLTVVNADGCTASVLTQVSVFPAIPTDTIAYSPDLSICEGEIVTLTAPAGYTYSWSPNGETSQTISVGIAGIYGVTIKDINNCSLVLEPVRVTVIPKPDAFISGNLVICDNGCITLTGPSGFGYSYQWLDDTDTPIPFQTAQTLIVCDYNLLPSYSLIVTDTNGCSSKADPVIVTLEVSPSFSITVNPDNCEGSPSTLTISPVQTDVNYTWSTGETGTSITVIQAGTYTAIGTNINTGCKSTATTVIHPLPDLCLVPVGCYETCNPDTICAPAGLTAYQWNLDGLPIAGETGQCLIVTQSGTYSLTGTNEFGCTLTTDDLELTVIDCGCEALEVKAKPLEDCCWSITYENNYGDLFGLMIHTGDADLDFDLGGLDPSLSVYTIGDNWIGLVNSTAGLPLPSGILFDFITVCLSNVQNDPQQIVFDWYDFDFEIVCTDTLELDCPVEPDCLYMTSDSIYCEDGQVIYDMRLCNPLDNDFNIEYIQIIPSNPVGIIVSPPFIDLSGNPLTPGECRDFSITLSGNNISNENFCYKLIAHEFNPIEVDTALCCSFDTTYCIAIPDCDPCDDIGIEGFGSQEDCCFDIYLYNNFDANYFDGIALCMLTPNTSMTINNPFGSGWITNTFSPTFIDLDVSLPIGNTIPTGTFGLPEICIQASEAASQFIEIKWMRGDEIVCRDTIELRCEPDCGYILEEQVECVDIGVWNYSGSIKNTSSFTMHEGHFVFTSPSGMSIYDQVITFGSLAPGATFPFNFNIGTPAMAGDTICFTLALHELGDDSDHTNCCNISHCFVLPECDFDGTAPYEEPDVYPNPSGGIFDIEMPVIEDTEVNFQLFDTNNKLIKQWEYGDAKSGETIPVDISNKSRGLYILVIQTARERWVKRVVIQ